MKIFTNKKNIINLNNSTKIANNGFTLVELMVATSLFTIIMLMGIGSLVVSSNSAKAAQKLRIAVDNVNFAMESMTRELRTGTRFYCDTSSVSVADDAVKDCEGGNVIAFTPQQVGGSSVSRIAYLLQERVQGSSNYTLKRCEGVASTADCPEIVSSEVNVKNLKFYVRGSNVADKIQPSVQILMNGVVKVRGVETPFTLQSMASQRSSE
jgi:prepilin-type N-terminal cleavage/methylation domain-containing protein